MIQTCVVGDKLEHQPQATLAEPLAQASQGRIPTESISPTGAVDTEFMAADRMALVLFQNIPTSLPAQQLLGCLRHLIRLNILGEFKNCQH
jgi:hypothetical protein